jgi:hypothetical protein
MEQISTHRFGVKLIYAGVALALVMPVTNNLAGQWIVANSNVPRIVGADFYDRMVKSFEAQTTWKYATVETLDTGDLPQFTDSG